MYKNAKPQGPGRVDSQYTLVPFLFPQLTQICICPPLVADLPHALFA